MDRGPLMSFTSKVFNKSGTFLIKNGFDWVHCRVQDLNLVMKSGQSSCANL